MNVALGGLELDGMKNDFDIRAGDIQVVHNLTGESLAYSKGPPGRLVPLKNFKLGADGWGAFQVAARYDVVGADDGILDLGYADAGPLHGQGVRHHPRTQLVPQSTGSAHGEL